MADDLTKSLSEFQALASTLAGTKFKTQDFCLTDIDHEAKRPKLETDWNPFWQNLDFEYNHHGVYIFWNRDKTKCYVGKSSQDGSYLGQRIWAHLGTKGRFRHVRDTDSIEKAMDEWRMAQFEDPVCLTVIFLPESLACFATALEEYLIKNLPAVWNSTGRRGATKAPTDASA